jgi:hypothetical protein
MTSQPKNFKRKPKPTKRNHGGKRDNSGRKAMLDQKGRLDVGSWCEAENKRLRAADRAQHEAEHPDLEVYHDHIGEGTLEWIHEAKTPEDRAKRLEEHATSIAEELPKIRSSRAFRQLHQRKKDSGLRKPIIQAAWVHFRDDYPRLTPGSVDSAWKWFRRYEKQFRDSRSWHTPNPDNAHFADET